MRVPLPWPPRALSPNARTHWGTKARAVNRYRADCRYAAKAMGLRPVKADALRVHLTFHPPNGNRRDDDNLIASVKPGLDGLADVLGVDDGLWTLSHARGEPRKGGAVIVEIETGGAG